MVERQSGTLNDVEADKGIQVDIEHEELAAEAFGAAQKTVDSIAAEANIPLHVHAEPLVSENDFITVDLDTEDWMSKLREDEIFNGPNGPAPRLHGLRRLARPFVLSEESRVNALTVVPREYVRALDTKNGEGHVMSSSDTVGKHFFPMASVTFFITLKDGRTFSDSADAYFPSIGGGDESKAVALHPTAVASARAEARTLRKILGIREHAAEELVERDAGEELAPDDDSPIKGGQAKLIDKMLGQLNLGLKDLLEHVTVREVFSVEELTTGEARKALRLLNEHKKKTKKRAVKK